MAIGRRVGDEAGVAAATVYLGILSVNRDPGRAMKYWGSILIVLGSILLFAMKYWKKKVNA